MDTERGKKMKLRALLVVITTAHSVRCFDYIQTTFKRQIPEVSTGTLPLQPMYATQSTTRVACFETCHFTTGCQSVMFDGDLCQLYNHTVPGYNGDTLFAVVQRTAYSNEHDFTASKCTENGYVYNAPFSVCYKADTTLANNTYARQLCSQSGGRLMVIDSSMKQNFIESITFPTGVGVSNFRIDALKSGGTWRYADGREITSFYWGTGQPSNGYPTICIEMTSHKWNDVHVNYNHAVLCEKVL
ncbi:CD209 antigen-like protein D [Ostrea edulis]|uniref:CD209 antigen-like protein D n=1 Tax=Ostrea edulis TaxID=37623 RepID=UPI002094B71E|nr:CD209 antigen-like protein D [Ostrea edulis]